MGASHHLMIKYPEFGNEHMNIIVWQNVAPSFRLDELKTVLLQMLLWEDCIRKWSRLIDYLLSCLPNT